MRRLISVFLALAAFNTVYAINIPSDIEKKAVFLGNKYRSISENNATIDKSEVANTTYTVEMKLTVTPTGEINLSVPGSYNFYVSGVCDDGFIECTPGTWNNCIYHKVTPSSITVVPKGELHDCFCVSSACNFSWSKKWFKWTLDKFTQMLGWDSAVEMEDSFSSNSAVRTFKFTNAPSIPTKIETVANIIKTNANDTNLVTNAITKDDNYTFYQNALSVASSNYTTGTCTWNLGEQITSIQTYPATVDERALTCDSTYIAIPNTSYLWCVKSGKKCELTLESPAKGSAIVEWHIPDDPCLRVWVDGKLVYSPYGCSKCDGTCSASGTKTFTGIDDSIKVYSTNEGACYIGATDAGAIPPTVTLKVFGKELPKGVSLSVSSCPYMNQPECKLWEEKWCVNTSCKNYKDYIETVRKGVRVKNIPTVSWYAKTSLTGSYWKVVADGKKIYITDNNGDTYIVYNDSTSDLDKLIAGRKVIRKYICTGNLTDVSKYLDYAKEKESKTIFANATKKIEYTGGDISFSTETIQGSAPPCKLGDTPGYMVCKVAVSNRKRVISDVSGNYKENTVATSAAPPGDINKIDTGNGNMIVYRACINDNGTYTCPVGVGETLIEDCTCKTENDNLNAITKAAAAGEIAEEISNATQEGIICSSEPPKY